MDYSEIRALLAQLQPKDDWQTVDNTIETLAGYGAEAVPILLNCLTEHKGVTKTVIIGVLGKISDKRALTTLTSILLNKRESVKIRANAIVALGEISDGSIVELLLCVFNEDKNPLIRATIIPVLGHFGQSGNIEAIKTIEQALADEDKQVRDFASSWMQVLQDVE
jgi:HEAT repeat protein